MPETAPQTQAETIDVDRQPSTPEEHAAHITALTREMIDRVKAVDPKYRTEGTRGITLYESNAYGSTGKGAEELTAGENVVGANWIGRQLRAQIWHKQTATGPGAWKAEMGPATGAVTIEDVERHSLDSRDSRGRNVAYRVAEGNAYREPAVWEGTDTDGAYDALAEMAGYVHEAEARQAQAEAAANPAA